MIRQTMKSQARNGLLLMCSVHPGGSGGGPMGVKGSDMSCRCRVADGADERVEGSYLLEMA